MATQGGTGGAGDGQYEVQVVYDDNEEQEVGERTATTMPQRRIQICITKNHAVARIRCSTYMNCSC